MKATGGIVAGAIGGALALGFYLGVERISTRLMPRNGVTERVIPLRSGEDLRRGSVVVVEFSDFQCPFCGHFARNIRPALLEQFVATKRVAWLSRQLPLSEIHPLAVNAAIAAVCADVQGREKEMNSALFFNQKMLSPENLLSHAEKIDLDIPKFERCQSAEGKAMVLDDLALAEKLKIESTPTMIIGVVNRRSEVEVIQTVSGARPLSVFVELVEAAIRSTGKNAG